MNMQSKTFCALGLVLLGVGITSSARATISYEISNAGLEAVNVSFDGTAYNGVLAGGIGINSTSGNTVAICTDFLGSLYLGNTYTYNSAVSVYTPGLTGVAPVWGADSGATTPTLALENAAQLFNNNVAVLTGNNTAAKAGLQLAIWDALYNTTGQGTVTGTRFSFGAGTAADAYASIYLSGLVDPSTLASDALSSVGFLIPNPDTAANGQNPDGSVPQELLVATPVPEASTMIAGALLLLPFGLCSLKSLRKTRI